MLNTICNKKGMSMVEVLIAIVLTSIGVMALLALHPTGWKTMAKSDYLGRATGILLDTLQNYENRIVNPCYDPTSILGTSSSTINISGQSSAVSGDVAYTITRTITQVSTTGNKPRVYSIQVTVTWPMNLTGITESILVSTQPFYDFPPNCTEI